MRIVPSLDEVEDGHAGIGLCGKTMAVEQLTLDGGEEAFTHRVVVAVPDRPHRRTDPGTLAALAKGQGSVLGRFKWSSQHLNSEELRWDRGRKIERLIVLVGRRCGHRDGRLGGGVNTNNDFGKQ